MAAKGTVLDPIVPRLAARILALETERRREGRGAAPSNEWQDLVVALWKRLRASRETRRSMRLPSSSTITLRAGNDVLEARIIDVSHDGLRIRGALRKLHPGFRATWIGSRVGDASFALDVPCHVIWRERGTTEDEAGLEFVNLERRVWGPAFFEWYYSVYVSFLGALANVTHDGRVEPRKAAERAPSKKKAPKKEVEKKTGEKKTVEKKKATKKKARAPSAKARRAPRARPKK